MKSRRGNDRGASSPNGNGQPAAPPPPAAAPPPVGAQGVPRSQLGQLLVSAQLISHDQLAEALIEQSTSGQRIGMTLGRAGSDQRARPGAGAVHAAARAHRATCRSRRPPPKPSRCCRRAWPGPIWPCPSRWTSNGITIAVADPNPELAKTLANACGRIVRLVIAPRSDVQRAIDTAYRALGNIDEHVRAFEEIGRHTAADRRHRRPDRPARRRPGGAGGQPAHHPGPARPRLGHPHRAPGRPCGCGTASTAPCTTPSSCRRPWPRPSSAGSRSWPSMNIVERRRPQDGQITMQRRRPRDRHPGLDGRHHLGRELRHAGPRQEPVAVPHGRPRHAA